MSLLDSVASLFRPVTPVAIVKAEARQLEVGRPTIAIPDKSIVGVTGTPNYDGLLLTEENSNLQQTAAYGVAGSSVWGWWEHAARTNPACAMALEKVTGPLRDARFDFVSPKNREVDPKILAACEWAFGEMLEPGIEEVAENAAWGFLSTGFALNERVWDTERLDGRELMICRCLPERLPSSLSAQPWRIADGELIGVEQQSPGDDGKGVWVNTIVPAGKLLLFTHQRQGNNFAGFSAFRSVYIHVKVMEMLVKLIGISLQREGAGIPIATTTDANVKLNDSQRRTLQQYLANLTVHENASAVMPPGVKLEWLYSPGANKGHVVAAYNALMLIVLQTLQAQQMVLGVQDTGARAVGQIHVDAARAFLQKVVRNIEGVFNGVGRRPYTGVVRQFVDVNFGPQQHYPMLRITLQREEADAGLIATAASSFVSAGLLTVTAKDENTVREKLGFEPITEDERDAERQRKSDLALAIGGAQNEDEADDEKRKPPMRSKASRVRGARPLRHSERFLAVSEMEHILDVAPEQFERVVRPLVVELLARAQPEIAAAMADGDPSEVATLQLDTTRLTSAVRLFLQRLREDGGQQVRAELARAGVESRVAGAAEEEDDVVDQTSELLSAQARATVRRIENRLRSELEAEAIDAVRTGADEAEVVDRTMSTQLATGAFKADGRAITTKAFNLGREEAAQLLGATEAERSAAMDRNTCGVCERKDGMTAAIGTPEHDALQCPDKDCDGGAMCRCVNIYRKGDAA